MITDNDFIGIFPNAVSKEYCEKLINHFDYMHSANKVVSRQAAEGVPKMIKDNKSYYFESETDPIVLPTNFEILQAFNMSLWDCYNQYVNVYGVLPSLEKHKISSAVKIQKVTPTEGYHVWHCEHGSDFAGRRLLLVILYLNDVEEGGETEFLYQRKRIKPKAGTIIICPSGFTHTHRGNPPLSGDKYIINTWFEFI